LLNIGLQAQSQPQFTHFSVDDGLSENNVVSILQDRKGFMWFGTYDGLNKYDGYSFRSFKGLLGQKFKLINYRVDKIKEDRYGYLWVQTYDGRVYRFDPSRELFLAVPQCISSYSEYKKVLKEISIMPDGSVWLWSKDGVNDDCFRIQSTPGTEHIRLSNFSKSSGDLPSDKISCIFQDSRSCVWILTDNGISLLPKHATRPQKYFCNNKGYGMYSIVQSGYKIYIGGERGKILIYDQLKGSFEQLIGPSRNNIIDLKMLNDKELFVLYNRSECAICRPDQKTFSTIAINKLPDNEIYGCYTDRKARIWIDTKFSGAIYLDVATRRLNYLPSPATDEYPMTLFPEFKILEDHHDNLWILTKAGGFYSYNQHTNALESFYNNPASRERKFSNLLHTGMIDKGGNLWLSTFSQGIDKVVFRQSQFSFTQPFDLPAYSLKNEVRSVFRDSKNWLWVGSRKGYVYLYDEHLRFKGLLGYDGRINGNVPFDIPVYCIFEDHQGVIWLGSRGKGLFRLSRKPDNTFNVSNYQYNPDDIYSIGSNAVYSVYQDHLHRLWVATFGGGINRIDFAGNQLRFISARNQLRNYPMDECAKTRYITEDKNGYVYVGTTGGLIVFKADQKSAEDISFRHFSHNPTSQSYLSGNDVQYVLITRKGDVYLALFGGGINRLHGGYQSNQSPRFEVFEKEKAPFCNVVYTLNEDEMGCIWMSTQTKIIRFNPDKEKFDYYKPINNNGYFFVEAAACKARNGELFYGTSDGFLAFHPSKIRKSSYRPRIGLTQLQLFNKAVQIGAEGSPLQQCIDDTKELIFSHKQNIFSIEFAALDYVNSPAIQYAFKLEGLESEWNYVGTQHIATYNNLPHGRYNFHVKSTNADGEWVDNERTLTIIKEPSFWESAWGWMLYIVLFLILLALTSHIFITIYKLRNEVDVEHRITQMKLRFFTDISHELRTPLTLIASPVEFLLKKESLSDNAREQLLIVQRNTDRMLRLINQILDFRKIQNKKMNLIIEMVDTASFLNDICFNFRKLAEDNHIHLSVSNHADDPRLWVDKDKFEKIIYNLLSNAFKFSQNGKKVEIILNDDDTQVCITIKDQGVGISKDKLKLLFERFESFATNNISFQASTGIGLSLTKELVEMHHARIDVESELGKGSAFKISFLKGTAHYSEKDNFVLQDLIAVSASENTNPTSAIEDTEIVGFEPGSELPKILIVEDNRELLNFLRTALSANYDVFEAENGIQALDIALKYSPDLIVSDLMMPDMDGLELAKRLKSDLNISHIPVVLLTAKTDMDSKLHALELGVDDYITKPFSSTYLEARIENLLKLRRKLQSYFRTSLTTGVISLSKPNITNQDEEFVNKTMKFIEENYVNPDMNIEEIAVNSGLSRSSFFKKLKSVTGLAPVDFVKEFRLQRAKQYLEAGESNISQVSYNVGIDDPRYFSKCFKQKYGINPSEYKLMKKQEDKE
jgi:signal transduction histidine kinase/ligand-binding sensor domain-containing protein/DNA-binding NarL/FixJ family response regulator